jgi:hypothetical protein
MSKRNIMNASYLIRFDDICPTMNWDIWSKIEEILLKNNIKPIIAVVPNNLDQALVTGNYNPLFWDKIRKLQAGQLDCTDIRTSIQLILPA